MTLRQTVSRVTRRIRNVLPRYNQKTVNLLVKTAVDVEKVRRSLVTQSYIETVDKIVDQPWPYLILKKYSNKHPFLRIVHGAIIREVVRNRWDVKEKFAKKCVTCGQEFMEPVEECPDCREKGFLRDPNPLEKKRLETFLKNPNRDDKMITIIKSLMKDGLAVDDWYLSMVEIAPNQWAIYVEDAAEMFICADKHGRLGNGVYFCRNCWTAGQDEKIYKKPGQCPDCGTLLKETAYVQKHEGTVKARFGRDEIIHGNSDPWLPQLYGNSKAMAILLDLRAALAMSSYNFSTYSKGHVAKIVILKGLGQNEVAEIVKAVDEQAEKVTIDSWTGQITRESSGAVWVGTPEGGEVHDVMPDPEKMQSLDWMEYWFVKMVGGIYGVQPVMMNAPTRGPGGYFQRQQIVVQNDTTRENQKGIEDPFNEQLLPRLGIHDWEFRFNEIEPRNELEEAQIWQTKVAAGTAAVNAGLKAELTDEGELKISGEFQKTLLPQGARAVIQDLPEPPKVPQPKQPPPFSTEKKLGEVRKKYVVEEIEVESSSSDSESDSGG